MLGPLNIYEQQINVRNTQLLVTITEQDKEKDKPKLSFKIISQNYNDLRLHIEEALAIKTLKPELKKKTSRGNGNWLSPLNSFTAPPSLS